MITLHPWPRLLRKEMAEEYCGGPKNLSDLERDFGLRPARSGHKATAYDREELDKAISTAVLANWTAPDGPDTSTNTLSGAGTDKPLVPLIGVRPAPVPPKRKMPV